MVSVEDWRRRSRFGLSVFYSVGGVLHLAIPGPFLSITPAWVPDAPDVILLTGVCEIAGAVGLLVPSLRNAAGIALAIYAAAVFPANIKHALDALSAASVSPWAWIYHAIRLPMQPVIIWLSVFAGNGIRRPLAVPDA